MLRISIYHCLFCGDLVFLVEGLGRICLQGCRSG